jgi:hypothetical protein
MAACPYLPPILQVGLPYVKGIIADILVVWKGVLLAGGLLVILLESTTRRSRN